METILIGNKNNGWEIHKVNKSIKLYNTLSFINKLRSINNSSIIFLSDIKYINVGWNNVPLAYGSDQHFVIFEIVDNDGKLVQFDGTHNGITKEQFIEGVKCLKEFGIVFNDQYNILDQIFNSNKSIWEILNNCEIERCKK